MERVSGGGPAGQRESAAVAALGHLFGFVVIVIEAGARLAAGTVRRERRVTGQLPGGVDRQREFRFPELPGGVEPRPESGRNLPEGSCAHLLRNFRSGSSLREQPAEKQLLYYGSNGYVFNFKDNYFAVDPLAFLEERITTNEKRTAYWSLALLDANLEVKKEYINPAFVGREKELWENRFTGAMANHWMEEGPFVDAYQDHFGLLYYRGDTIYEYQEATQEFAPAYILKIGSQPSFADAHQQYNREQSYFNALTIHVFAQTENKLYFQATKSDKAYTIAYNKADGKLKVHAYDTEIEERKFPQFPDYVLRYYPDNTLYIKNDLAGGEFSLDYKSSGKYWISILDSDKLEDFEAANTGSPSSTATSWKTSRPPVRNYFLFWRSGK